ncbi:MAG: zinc ribbon domain-containing protein [Acetobacterium sp.]|uniref:Zinc-ribbon domain-containing protein n=1 Tax=Acetobacterium malicum TaxID=52692 RepID=A0ABR6Z1M8_9FIRM|nr:zinc ribbon domain-containing protein [Acetobacterium malicum]MBC3901430.1 zinc-ribbon domain-containing protein [Acetobacterium malicum]MBU4439687.1 zinc ribbon domain-containing protein [Bacillota bacterium]MCG2728792.1 zinc ribbon domain-containing protein [Acetobacterium sp.]
MTESKVYKLSATLTTEMVAEKLRFFLSDQKKLNAEVVQTSDGILVQAKAAQSWKKFAGMDSAIQVQLTMTGENMLTVNIGSGQWVDKAGAAAVGALIFWPLLATSAIGAWGQQKLPEEIVNFLDQTIRSHSGAEVLAKTPPSNTISCPHCRLSNSPDNRFCQSCGTKLETTCPHCLALIPLGLACCPECETSLLEKASTCHCPQCHAAVSPGQKFCLECGTSFPVFQERRCPQCHTPVNPGQKFCAECGTLVNAETPPRFCLNCKIEMQEDQKFCYQCGSPAPPDTTEKIALE